MLRQQPMYLTNLKIGHRLTIAFSLTALLLTVIVTHLVDAVSRLKREGCGRARRPVVA